MPSILDFSNINFTSLALLKKKLGLGTNTARAGNATLIGGTATVANTTVTAATVVMLTRKTAGGTPGTVITYTLNPGTSFVITSNNGLDTSVFSWLLVESV